MDAKIRKWNETSWQLHPTLHMKELYPEAVQYAVFNSNPIVDFRKVLQENNERFRTEVLGDKDPKRRELVKKTQMISTWDLLFRNIQRDRVHILAASHGDGKRSPVRTTLLSSNSLAERKWLATKIGYLSNAPLCWCVQLDLTIGKTVPIILDKGNCFDLQQHYHEIVETN